MLRDLIERVRNKLLQRYRVELIDDETMYQSREFRVRPITVVGLISLAFLLVVGSTMALVIYVPIFHRMIPNYINPDDYKKERAEMASRVLQAEEQIDKLIAYNQNFQRLAGGGADDPQFSQARLDSMREVMNLTQEEMVMERPTPPLGGESSSEPENILPPTTASPIVQSPVSVVKTSLRPVLDGLFLPLEGRLSNPYSEQGKHYGVDIVAEGEALIKSATDGFVLFAEYSEDNGWVISISAGQDNVVTFYKHNSRLLKEVGSYVRAGEAIAVIGNTGENSTGPHLHFELWQNGKPLDPENYINFQ